MDTNDQPNDLLMPPPHPPPPPPYDEIIADQHHQGPDNSSITAHPATSTCALKIATPGPDAANYRLVEPEGCCCSIRSCVCVIGSFDVVQLSIATVAIVAFLNPNEMDKTLVIVLSVVACVIALKAAIVAMLFYAIAAERPGFLIPYMVLQVLDIIGALVACVMQLVAQNHYQFVGWVIRLLFVVYLFVQVTRCYTFLELKSRIRQVLIGA